MQINCPQPDTLGRSRCWCQCGLVHKALLQSIVTKHVTVCGSGKQQEEPFLLYPVFQRDICCSHQVLFVMPCVGSFYSKKIKEREGQQSLGEHFQDWAEGAAAEVAFQSLPCTWVGGTGLGGLDVTPSSQAGPVPSALGSQEGFQAGA